MTLLNFAWHVRTCRGPLLILMHSHLPLSCQSRSFKITAWKKTAALHLPPTTSSLPLIHSQWSTLWLMEWTLQLKLKGRIWTASIAWILWTTEALETICRHVVQRWAIFIPVQPLCSSTCHLHSELPAVDLLTAAERVGSHNSSSAGEGADVAYILYLAVTMLFCWWSAILVQLKSTFVGNNISANYNRNILTHVKYSKTEAWFWAPSFRDYRSPTVHSFSESGFLSKYIFISKQFVLFLVQWT